MKKIYRLLFTELILNFLLTYLAFFIILFSIEFLDKIDELIAVKAGLEGTMKFFLLRIPFIHSQISLYATIISIMITLNILSQKNEITVLLSSGIPVKRFFNVFLSFIVFISFLTFINDNFLTPKYIYKSETILKKGEISYNSNLSNILFKSKEGFLYVDLFIPEKNVLLNTYIVTLGSNYEGIETVLFAKVISKDNDRWTAQEATVYSNKDRQNKKITNIAIPEFEFFKNLGKHSFKSEWLGIHELFRIINAARRSGIDVNSFYYQLMVKAINLLSFFLIFYLIFPFGFQLGRNKKNVEIIFTGILILLCYTVLKTFVLKVFKTTGIDPVMPVLFIALPMLALGILNWKRHFR
ncbi:MAG: hypothetical protein OHK0040_07910 [bacterium]